MNTDLFLNQYYPSTIWNIISDIDDSDDIYNISDNNYDDIHNIISIDLYYDIVQFGVDCLFFYKPNNLFSDYFQEFNILQNNKESTKNIIYILRALSYYNNDLFQNAIADYIENIDEKDVYDTTHDLVLAGYCGFKIEDNNGYFTFNNKFATRYTDYLNLGYIRRFPELSEYNLFVFEQDLVNMKIINDDKQIIEYIQNNEDPQIIVQQDKLVQPIKTKRKYIEKQYKSTGSIQNALSNLKMDTKYIGTNKSIQYLRMF